MNGFILNCHFVVAVLCGAMMLVGQGVNSELFTALVEMEDLLETEAVLITNLENYIQVQEEKLDFLRDKADEYRKVHTEASMDILEYLSNPINAFRLTKRLTTDWREVENLMLEDVGSMFIENVTNYRNVLKFPTDEDLNGAATALTRLQDTYKLETSSLARGELNGVKYSSEMTVEECFELGRQSYMNRDFHHSIMWMREAMDRLAKPQNKTVTTKREDILEYLAFSMYKEGNVNAALVMTNELLEILPNHERARGNKGYYEKELEEMKATKKLRGDVGTEDVDEEIVQVDVVRAKGDAPEETVTDHKIYTETERQLYEKLCRGEVKPAPIQLAPLRCRYVTNNVPFLKLAPLKLEEAHLAPYIVIYHDVLSDDEISTIQNMSKPRFRRATVQNHKTGELETANYRISKSAWLKDEEHHHVRAISQRVEDMTGLTMTTAEELQVVNYGIGGHYEPHFDFARKDEVNAFKSLGTGNRIATVLFYMSDVTQGGATVFPSIRTALWPSKGSAAFWFNLHASGEGDYLTRHAACPVLAGTKWVCNKWIHERGQEFRRPCKLWPDHPAE